MPALPPQAQLARWAIKYGPLLLPVAKRMYEHGRFRQLSILHARTLVDGAFSWELVDGERVWVVWSGDEVVATYPEVQAGPDGLFPTARPDRRQHPDDVVVRRVRRRLSELPRPAVLDRFARSDADDEDTDQAPGATDEG